MLDVLLCLNKSVIDTNDVELKTSKTVTGVNYDQVKSTKSL